MPADRRALLVGIDKYANFADLAGCGNDVDALEPLLQKHGAAPQSVNFDCRPMKRASRDQLLAAIKQLLEPGVDVALLFFAGHGTETDNDVVLTTEDGTAGTPGVGFSELLPMINKSEVDEVIIILDCCFSGGAGGVPQIGGDTALLREGVTILAASRGDQTAAELPATFRGLFTTYLESALDGGAADIQGRVTVAGLYSYVTDLFSSWEQRPTFKSNVDRLHVLRQCEPDVDMADLKRLPELFATADAIVDLNPSYEPQAEPHDAANEADFAAMQRMRAVKLVEPTDEEHLYYAAMNSSGVQLTPLGRHYWLLVHKGRL